VGRFLNIEETDHPVGGTAQVGRILNIEETPHPVGGTAQVVRIYQLVETDHPDQPVENTEKNEGGELDRVK
jgi:hypothetical protein